MGVTALTIYGNTHGGNVQIDSVDAYTKVTVWGSSKDVFGGPASASVTRDFYAPPGPVQKVPGSPG
jgi:hypothetical protein